jgi:hypothetical protein
MLKEDVRIITRNQFIWNYDQFGIILDISCVNW